MHLVPSFISPGLQLLSGTKGLSAENMCYSFNHVCIKGAKDVNGMKYYTKAHLFCESTNLAVYVLWDVWLPNQTLPTRVILTP